MHLNEKCSILFFLLICNYATFGRLILILDVLLQKKIIINFKNSTCNIRQQFKELSFRGHALLLL